MDVEFTVKLLQPIATHLEFFGYTTAFDADFLLAKHESKPNISVSANFDGFLVAAVFRAGSAAATDVAGFYAFVNQANLNSIVSRFYYVVKDNSMAVESWYPLNYDKRTFGIFVTAIP